MGNPIPKIRVSRRLGGVQYPSDLDQSPVCFMISLSPYQARGDVTGLTSQYIYLPMPTNGLVDNFSIDFKPPVALGAIGGIAASFSANPLTTLSNVVGGGLSGLAIAAKSIGGSLAESIGDLVGEGEAAGAAVDLMSGFVNNPNYAILFEGVKPRKFSFKWTMVAKNEEDANHIEMIVRLLKTGALPSKQFGANFALNYPNIAYLGVLGPSTIGISKQMYLTFSEKGTFITDISVNYSGAGHASFFKDNKPVQVDLSLSFQERGIITSDDIIS